jgi:hypothetical protein
MHFKDIFREFEAFLKRIETFSNISILFKKHFQKIEAFFLLM